MRNLYPIQSNLIPPSPSCVLPHREEGAFPRSGEKRDFVVLCFSLIQGVILRVVDWAGLRPGAKVGVLVGGERFGGDGVRRRQKRLGKYTVRLIWMDGLE